MTKDSRLERFLKALCSLDYSDLPTPLSRVEVLWSCLVTGETAPDFQPQSRTEKYLMSILGVYDLEDIPQPISRAEMLLYKLATGDTNVELEGGAKSRYEELLAEIVGYTDFYYTTHTLTESLNTLYNTVEAPVKSAILKGQTLVNLAGWNNIRTLDFGSISNNVATINFEHYYATMTIKTENMIKQNTTYTFIIDSKVTKSEVDAHDNPPRQNGVIISFTDGTFQTPMTSFQNVGERMLQKIVFTIENKEIQRTQIRLFTASLGTSGACQGEVYSVMLIEGDYTNTDIPYFEGMQSVKMPVLTTTGKNLFDVNGEKELSCFYSATLNGHRAEHNDVDTYTIKIKPNTEYFLTCEGLPSMSHITYWDENLSYIGAEPTYGDDVIRQTTSPQGAKYMRLPIHKEGVLNIQIEEGSVATSYEPFKSNILTVNEPVELRGIGDVKDELNLITGELTQRIEENSNLNTWGWSDVTDTYFQSETHRTFMARFSIMVSSKPYPEIVCNVLPYLASGYSSEKVGISTYQNNIYIKLLKTDVSSIDEFRQWLIDKSLVIHYQLATESIKTVDLSILNQDDKPTKLKTFDDITYVDISSNGLLPELETTVLTKNLEQLSTMGLRMNDILDDQERIKDDNNALNNDLESTMLATTEIYEDIL